MFIVPISSLTPLESISEQEGAVKGASTSNGVPFAEVLGEAMNTLQESQALSEQDAIDLARGDVSDLHTLMINSSITATAVETAVQLTSRAVSAYKEIMQVQV